MWLWIERCDGPLARVLEIACKFYEELFSTKEINRKDSDFILSKIENSIRTNPFEDKIRIEEIRAAINASAKGKAPGPDGIPNEWYQEHIEDISPKLERIFNEIYSSKILPESMTKSNITLIYKKGDRTDLLMWLLCETFQQIYYLP
jgi:hypothetical protein